MKTVKILAIAIVALFASVSVKAQLSVGTDLVSSYVWRGVAQTAGPAIQPTLSYTIGGFTIGAWGSASLGGLNEFDLYATYAINDKFSLTVTDYQWSLATTNYLDYTSATGAHLYEASANYAGIESFPLSASLNVMFAGADKLANGNMAYSSYLELGYPITSDLKAIVGAALNESASSYATTGFAFTNVALKATKSIAITDKFSLPLYGVAGVNPNAKSAFFVVGVTL